MQVVRIMYLPWYKAIKGNKINYILFLKVIVFIGKALFIRPKLIQRNGSEYNNFVEAPYENYFHMKF